MNNNLTSEESGWVADLKRSVPAQVSNIITRNGFEEITLQYLANRTHYHTPAHIIDCLNKISYFKPKSMIDLGSAILFHDIVYNVNQSDVANVDQSRQYAKDFLSTTHWLNFTSVPVILPDIQNVETLIGMTNHLDSVAYGDDRDIIRDIDMSILAEPHVKYIQYAQQIMNEYTRYYSMRDYVAGRRQFLEKMLKKCILTADISRKQYTGIFLTPEMKYHATRAYTNMKWELENL